MCFNKGYYADNEYRHVSARKASRDIPVYKVLLTDWRSAVAPFRNMLYFHLDTIHESVIKKAEFADDHRESEFINEGLHSYTTLRAALQAAYSLNHSPLFPYLETHYVYKAYIPKGATYYKSKIEPTAVSTELKVMTTEIKG